MSRKKRIDLMDTMKNTLDARPDDAPSGAPLSVPVEDAVAPDDTALDTSEASSTPISAAPTARIETTTATAALKSASAIDAPEPAPPRNTAPPPPTAPIAKSAQGNTPAGGPAPIRIGILGGLGGLTGAAALPTLIGLGAGFVPMIACMALGTLAGLTAAAPRNRGDDGSRITAGSPEPKT